MDKDKAIVIWTGVMFLLAVIYIIHLAGFIETLEYPKLLGKSLYGIFGLIWGLFGFFAIITYKTLKE